MVKRKKTKEEGEKKTVHNFYNSISSITRLFGASATDSHTVLILCVMIFTDIHSFVLVIIFTVDAQRIWVFRGGLLFSPRKRSNASKYQRFEK